MQRGKNDELPPFTAQLTQFDGDDQRFAASFMASVRACIYSLTMQDKGRIDTGNTVVRDHAQPI